MTLQVGFNLEIDGFSYEIGLIHPRENFSRRILSPPINPALYTFDYWPSSFSRQPFIMALFSVLRHLVQMYILVGLPSRITVWRCTLASQRVRV